MERREKLLIEYPEENSRIRQRFEQEIAKRGFRNNTPDDCYSDPNYECSYCLDPEDLSPDTII